LASQAMAFSHTGCPKLNKPVFLVFDSFAFFKKMFIIERGW